MAAKVFSLWFDVVEKEPVGNFEMYMRMGVEMTKIQKLEKEIEALKEQIMALQRQVLELALQKSITIVPYTPPVTVPIPPGTPAPNFPHPYIGDPPPGSWPTITCGNQRSDVKVLRVIQ